MDDNQRFEIALSRTRETGQESIGTQAERMLHRTLKYFLEPDDGCHEVKIAGYVADVFQEEKSHIYEIQTRDFGRLREKLSTFCGLCRVTVVYPVIRVKTVYWIDPESGEVSPGHKSPRKGRETDILPELYRLGEILSLPNLNFMVVMMDGDEYRLQDGYSRDGKRGSHGQGKLPYSFVSRACLKDAADFREILPAALFNKEFTQKELGKALGLSGMKLSCASIAMRRLGLMEECGKNGRANLYKLSEVVK